MTVVPPPPNPQPPKKRNEHGITDTTPVIYVSHLPPSGGASILADIAGRVGKVKKIYTLPSKHASRRVSAFLHMDSAAQTEAVSR